MVAMESIHNLLGYDGLKIIQSDQQQRFSIDALLLADFVSVPLKANKIIELGCGNGPILLFLTLKTKVPLIGIELQIELCDLAIRSVALNRLEDQITIINQDYKTLTEENSTDVVISNPPYFPYTAKSRVSNNPLLISARHEIHATLEETIHKASQLLTHQGLLYMIHRSSRLEEIIRYTNEYQLKVRKLRFVYTKKNAPSPLVLIEAQKTSHQALEVLEPLFIYDESGDYSLEAKKIFHFKEKPI